MCIRDRGYNGPVLLLRADDDRLVDEGTCSRYAQVYTAPEVDTIADVYKRQLYSQALFFRAERRPGILFRRVL